MLSLILASCDAFENVVGKPLFQSLSFYTLSCFSNSFHYFGMLTKHFRDSWNGSLIRNDLHVSDVGKKHSTFYKTKNTILRVLLTDSQI